MNEFVKEIVEGMMDCDPAALGDALAEMVRLGDDERCHIYPKFETTEMAIFWQQSGVDPRDAVQDVITALKKGVAV